VMSVKMSPVEDDEFTTSEQGIRRKLT